MKKNLRWKVILVLAIVSLSIFLVLTQGIQLGLDLSGGVHLVLQVMTDDALNHETDQVILRLQDEMDKELITYEEDGERDNGKHKYNFPA